MRFSSQSLALVLTT